MTPRPARICPLRLSLKNNGTKNGKITYTHHSVLKDQEGLFNGGSGKEANILCTNKRQAGSAFKLRMSFALPVKCIITTAQPNIHIVVIKCKGYILAKRAAMYFV
ncbi:hypothetical protein D3C87_1341600 [compost metagenome]